MKDLALVEINHGDTFQPPRDPFIDRILTETVVNVRSEVNTHQTDHAMLATQPAPGTRIGKWTYAHTDGPVEVYDPTADGNKVDIPAGVQPDNLQDMLPVEPWQLNTLRFEAEPWDEFLLERI